MRKNIKKVAKIGVTGLLAAGLLVGIFCVIRNLHSFNAFSSALARIMHISTDEILVSLPSTNLISQLIPDFSKRCAYAVNIRFAVSF